VAKFARETQRFDETLTTTFELGQSLIDRTQRDQRDCLSQAIACLTAQDEGSFEIILCFLRLAEIFEECANSVQTTSRANAIASSLIQLSRPLKGVE
jgi:hypothetical protein